MTRMPATFFLRATVGLTVAASPGFTRRVRRFVRRAWRLSLSLAGGLAAACQRDDHGFSPAPIAAPPGILSSSVTANAVNVLSAVVSVRLRDADSVVVRYGITPAVDSATPAVAVQGDSAIVPVFGLLPGTPYSFHVVAHGHGVTAGPALQLTTDTLPADLPRFTASGLDPSPGFVVFAAGLYGLAIDNTGRVVWYLRFPSGPGLNFKAERTGRYFARPALSIPNSRYRWVEIDPLGNVIRSLGCVADREPRFHDLIAEPTGAYWIMCDEVRTLDLSRVGGQPNAKVTGTTIQHVGASGELLFQWSPFDHFDITDLEPASRAGSNVNWTHGNSIDLDSDGNLFVSFRNLNELTKIDTRTGRVLARIGGSKNQFIFQEPSGPSFSFQHALRVTAQGQLLLLDNLGDSTSSRVLRYDIDPVAATARLVGSYVPSPAAISVSGGSAQELPGGRTLVSFGPAGRVEEYDASGRVVWRIEGNPGYVFRAQRIRSLYQPGVGSSR